MENRNEVTITFDAYSVNEGFARMVAAAFAAEFNPTLDEIEDIKTAVSEAVTNAIIHGYEETKGKVHMALLREEDELTVSVEDFGKGIADIEKAKEPFLRQNRSWSVRAWGSRSWKRLWTAFWWSLSREQGRRSQ